MEKWRFAAKHGWASATGFLRLLAAQPGFACRLFGARLHFFLHRGLAQPLMTPQGFHIETPDTLIAYWSMFVERELHDPEWVGAIRNAPAPLVVDVGANAGVFSHYIHVLNPKARLICFEPLPAMAQRIRALMERTGLALECHQVAVSKAAGEAFLESPHGYDGTSHLANPGTATANALRVETVRLDDVLQGRRPTLIKIDVEGFECDVLAGGKQTVAAADYLIIEAQTPEHLARLAHALGPEWRQRKLGESDYLFWRGIKSCGNP